MKKIVYIILAYSLCGCVQNNIPDKIDTGFITKCAYVNVIKEPKMSCFLNFKPLGVTILNDVPFKNVAAGSSSDSQKSDEMNAILNNFDVDKTFSFKMYELFSRQSRIPLIRPEITDTLACIKEIKLSRKEENIYDPLLKQGFDCVLQSYVTWYGVEKPDKASNTKVNLKVNLRLIRIKDNKILWKNTDTDTYSLSDKSYEYEEFIANGGAKLREALVEAVDIAVRDLLNRFLTTNK